MRPPPAFEPEVRETKPRGRMQFVIDVESVKGERLAK